MGKSERAVRKKYCNKENFEPCRRLVKRKDAEDGIDTIIAEIEEMEYRTKRSIQPPFQEVIVPKPSYRIHFTLNAYPFSEELVMFGGKFCDQETTKIFGDMFFYNVKKNEWREIKTPSMPPPRCCHRAVTISNNGGELWIFGGKCLDVNSSTFYCYRDLWVYHFYSKTWRKVVAPGGPLGRSSHGMVYIKKQLFIFGGVFDSYGDTTYYNDLFSFSVTHYVWNKIETVGIPPTPRCDFLIFTTQDRKIVIYGGCNNEKLEKHNGNGHICTDMYLLRLKKYEHSVARWKWVTVRQNGEIPRPRCYLSGVSAPANVAFMFGGAIEGILSKNSRKVTSMYFDDLYILSLKSFSWKRVNVSENFIRRERETSVELSSDSETRVPTPIKLNKEKKEALTPSPRSSPALVIIRNTLYLYGGMFHNPTERCVYTFADLYSLDLTKMDGWNALIEDKVVEP